MKNIFCPAVLGLAILAGPVSAADAPDLAASFADASVLAASSRRGPYSKEQVAGWVDAELRRLGTDASYELLDTTEWSAYLDFGHFLPLSADGLPDGYRFHLSRFSRLPYGIPNAEVSDTGKLLIWRESCDFFRRTEPSCRASIRETVAHEVEHLKQWRADAAHWKDAAHYQCREVQAMAARGERPRSLRRQMAFYYEKCRDSRWKDDFAAPLAAMEALLR